MARMIKIKNNLVSAQLTHVTKSDKNPIEVFKSLIEKSEKGLLTGFEEIIVDNYKINRIIKDFRILHNSVFYGPLDVLDLFKIKSDRYLDNSVKAHNALEQLKRKGVVDNLIEIPAEYDIFGRTWRKYYEGVDLSTLKLVTEETQKHILEEHKKIVEEMRTLSVSKKLKLKLPKEEEIRRKLDKLYREFGSEEAKIPTYENRIKIALEALWSYYKLRNMDYNDRNVIINPKIEEIAIIDGYWTFA